MTMRHARPLTVEAMRGGLTESRHAVAAAIRDADGNLVATWGDVDAPVFPRSAVKPLQAVPLVETGAADAWAVSPLELALACASHTGTDVHTAPVAAWLARLGLDAGALACGVHPPSSRAADLALARRGAAPSALHNNCSGKHAGLLATARHCGEAVAGYERADHPVQRRVAAAIGAFAGVDPNILPAAIDGCSIPTLALPLAALARGVARLGAPDGLSPAQAQAARRIVAAMTAHPAMVAGEERFATRAMAATAGRVVVKNGAEGVMAACIPSCGLGFALKAADGAMRAAEAALAALLVAHGGLGEADRAALAELAAPPILNWRGLRTGAIVVTGLTEPQPSRPTPTGGHP